MGFRGIWGQEGKILLVVDGQLYNDLGYSGTQLDRIPVEQIERLEIIRGPGSVLYGGNAELAVVSVITRGAREKSPQATALYGRGVQGGDLRALDLRYGAQSDDLKLSAAAHFAQTQRSDRRYTELNGNSYSMKDNSDLVTRSLNVGLEKGGFRSRVIVDEFDTEQRDAFGASQSRATRINSALYLAEAAYDLKLGENWIVTPRFNMNQHKPWNERDEFFLYDKTFTRYSENLTVKQEHSRHCSFLGGMEFQQDRAKVSADTAATALWSGDSRRAGYENQAYFAQEQLTFPAGTVVAGGRYEYHSAYKGSFVPRLAWTKVWEQLHVKALYSRAFRTPSLENIRLNPEITPERLTTYEMETGYEFNKEMFASVSLFDTTIRKPIIYHYDPATASEYYSNDNPTGTRGFELMGKWKSTAGHYADISYSFYFAAKNRVPLYAVPGRKDLLLGWPAHKIALNSSFALGRGLNINPSGVFLMERYAYYAQDALGNAVSRRRANAVMLNVFIQKKGFLRKNLTVGAGVFDLLGSNYGYIQPYNSGHSPLPGRSKEFTLRVTYDF
jgi:outer membrane cobalamin receptor